MLIYTLNKYLFGAYLISGILPVTGANTVIKNSIPYEHSRLEGENKS